MPWPVTSHYLAERAARRVQTMQRAPVFAEMRRCHAYDVVPHGKDPLFELANTIEHLDAEIDQLEIALREGHYTSEREERTIERALTHHLHTLQRLTCIACAVDTRPPCP